ncbi:MAG: DUF1844 domain-containing protein [Bacteroidetes bacterium]|nr:DUF1844 domain-containing protein [Bacteroidota bacterium]
MDKEKNKQLFYSLVATFHATAMQQMGKIKNPLTDSIERNLEEAQMSIDILDMIEAKTKGNLDEDEARLLKSVLQDLKINYVDEVAKEQSNTQTKQ